MEHKTSRKAPLKDRLFDDFFQCTAHALEHLEGHFELSGLLSQVLGSDSAPYGGDEQVAASKARLRKNRSWQFLSDLYDFAVEGIEHPHHEGNDSLVIDGSDILKLLVTEDLEPCQDWWDIVARGDGRFALDEGQDLTLEKLALLADVDVRTVRNAISAGALVSYKADDHVRVDNASARAWLMGRKGYKPTIQAQSARQKLQHLSTPLEVSTYFRERRRTMPDSAQTLESYPGLTEAVLAELEAGVFRAPLSMVWPLADYYSVERKELLTCLMRVFFPEALHALSEQQTNQVAS